MAPEPKPVPPSFVRPNGSGGFRVDPAFITTPESIFATARLLRELAMRAPLLSGRMLDVGCGTKPYAALFRHTVQQHIGIDRPITLHGVRAIDAFSPADALPFCAESFDSVLCTEVLEHVPDPAAAWAEIARVLKPGGRAIVTTPFMYRVHEAPYDFHRFTPFAHQHWATQAGLHIQEIAPRGGYPTVLVDLLLKGFGLGVRGLRRLLKRPPAPGRGMRVVFSLLQWPLIRVLGSERIRAKEYTLGYVVVVSKPTR